MPINVRTRVARGFTLMEMMVAFMLTLVAVLSLVSVFPTGITSIQQSSDSVQAQTIAQAYMDYIREGYQTETHVPTGFTPAGTAFNCSPGSTQAPCKYAALNGYKSPGLTANQESNLVAVTFPTSVAGVNSG